MWALKKWCETKVAHCILVKMSNSSNVFVTILNLKILFNVKVLRFTQTNNNTDYNTKFTLREEIKINVLNFSFSQNFPKI